MRNNSNQKSNKKSRRSTRCNKNTLFLILSMFLIVNLIFGVNTLVANAKEETKPLYKYYQSYMVEKGDTLLSIAYEINDDTCTEKQIEECVEEMMHINSLDHKGTICYGNYIIVPYYSAEYK